MDLLNCYSIKLNPLSLEPLPSLIDGFFNVNTFVMEKEVWKDVVGYEGKYKVSNFGRMLSINYNGTGNTKEIKSYVGSCKYSCVLLYFNGKRKLCTVHRLVATAFISNPDNKPCVNHKNGIKTDNRIENLEWCTRSENMKHAYKNKLQISKKGEAHGSSKLSKNQVLQIRSIYDQGWATQTDLSIAYKKTISTIHLIVKRKTWRHL